MKVANGKQFAPDLAKQIVENPYVEDYIKNLFI
jgi:hypothetical protein